MTATVRILNGKVALELSDPTPVPVYEGEVFPAALVPQPNSGDPPVLQVTFKPIPQSAPATSAATSPTALGGIKSS